MLRLSRLLVVQKSLSPGEQQGLTAALRDRAVLFIGFFFFYFYRPGHDTP